MHRNIDNGLECIYVHDILSHIQCTHTLGIVCVTVQVIQNSIHGVNICNNRALE